MNDETTYEGGEGEFPAERRPRLTPQEALAVDAMARFSCGLGVMCANENRILDLLDAKAALLARAEQAEADRDTLRDELRNIANAKPSEWEPDVRDQFQAWAQNRARHTLTRAGGGA